jgi:hypothetical protein
MQEATQKQQNSGREASWLKEARKVKGVEKSEKWVTRPRGGEVKTTLVKNIWNKNK